MRELREAVVATYIDCRHVLHLCLGEAQNMRLEKVDKEHDCICLINNIVGPWYPWGIGFQISHGYQNAWTSNSHKMEY